MRPAYSSLLPLRGNFAPSLACSLVTAMLGLGFTGAAQAANLVSDPGFESATTNTEYFAGQSFDGGAWTVTAGGAFVESGDQYEYAGNNSLNLTYLNPYVTNSVAQTLSTVAGKTYTVSFFADSDAPNTFSLTENGVAVAGIPGSIVQNGFPSTVSNSGEFVDYTGTFTATSGSTILSFTGLGDPALGSAFGSVMIDDVNVQAAPTPEPGSVVLVLTGLSGLGGVVRRRLVS